MFSYPIVVFKMDAISGEEQSKRIQSIQAVGVFCIRNLDHGDTVILQKVDGQVKHEMHFIAVIFHLLTTTANFQTYFTETHCFSGCGAWVGYVETTRW